MDLITTKTITRIFWIFWIAINLSCLTIALKDVRVTVPAAVKRGDNANLTCHYDLENDTLYSIKWYKGKREFYRYTPQEDIPMKVFGVAGITVEKSMSNASNVMLVSMEPNSSGKYSCEVSADAPTFHTIIISGELEVVDLPKIPPRIDIDDKIYSIGNMLLANCTVENSKPLANLTWLLNNSTLRPHEIIRYNIIGDSTLTSVTSVLGLKLVLQSKHFRYKNLRLACKATIYNIYENTTEKILELNTTSNQIYTDDFITIGSSRHTQYDSDFNGYGDPHDIRMHHMQASPDRSTSAASSCSKCCSSFLLFFLTATTLYSSSINFIINKYNENGNDFKSNCNSHNSNKSKSNQYKKKINNNNNKNNILKSIIVGNIRCYDIGISICYNDSIKNIILIILLRISKILSISLLSVLSSLSILSSIFDSFVLINWSNLQLNKFININVNEKIKIYIQVLLRKSKQQLQSFKSISFIILRKLLVMKISVTEVKLSINQSLLSLLYSIIIEIIILFLRILSWSITILLKYSVDDNNDCNDENYDVDDNNDELLLVKMRTKKIKSYDICYYNVENCSYKYYNFYINHSSISNCSSSGSCNCNCNNRSSNCCYYYNQNSKNINKSCCSSCCYCYYYYYLFVFDFYYWKNKKIYLKLTQYYNQIEITILKMYLTIVITQIIINIKIIIQLLTTIRIIKILLKIILILEMLVYKKYCVTSLVIYKYIIMKNLSHGHDEMIQLLKR